MILDRMTEEGDVQRFYYKCPNPRCPNYGYKGAKKPENTEGEEVMK